MDGRLQQFWLLPAQAEYLSSAPQSILAQALSQRYYAEKGELVNIGNNEPTTGKPAGLACAGCGWASGEQAREGPVTIREIHGRLICSVCEDALNFAMD